MNLPSSYPADNLEKIRESIERAASRAGRATEEITLMAVSKMHSAEQIRKLYNAGVRHFGENRVQEWESKYASLTDLDATWHMIGHLQSNKVSRAVCMFDVIDSVDSVALAERLDRAWKEFGGTKKGGASRVGEPGNMRVLIEVRLDPGTAKSGVDSEDVPSLAESVLRMTHLELGGLMGVPPYFDDVEKVRPYFRSLRELRDATRAQLGRELPVLSMGMSHDFEVAIEEGATEIRIGTALFGERQKL